MRPRLLLSILLAAVAVVLVATGHTTAIHHRSRYDGEPDAMEFRESVVENQPTGDSQQQKQKGELQDREWVSDGGHPDRPVDGTAIILSNRNQLETMGSQMLPEGGTREEREQQEMQNLRKAEETYMKCGKPTLKNLHYSFEMSGSSSGEAPVMVARTNQPTAVKAAKTDAEKEQAVFRVVKGLAGAESAGTVSLQLMTRPDYYLKHENYKLVARKFVDSTAFRREASYRVQKGLHHCDRGYVTFESNVQGMYIQNQGGQLVLRRATNDLDRTRSSWRPVKPLARPYVHMRHFPFKVVAGLQLAPGDRLGRPVEYAMMFWVKPTAKLSGRTVLVHKGDSAEQNAFGFYFPSRSTRLQVISNTVATKQDAVINAATELPMHTWTHVAVVHTFAGRLQLYINGKLLVDNANAGRPRSNGGSCWAGGKLPASALLADVRYYQHLPTRDEVVDAFATKSFMIPKAKSVYLGDGSGNASDNK